MGFSAACRLSQQHGPAERPVSWSVIGPEEAVVRIRTLLSAVTGATMFALSSAPAQAQSIGTLTWQLQPYCNRVTLTITQNGGIYTLDGYDDQCGAAQRAPLVGIATPNPDGSIGFGLTIVTVPSGLSVHVESRVSLGTLGGPWTDSAGNSGTLVFNGAAAGAARPAPTVPGTVLAVGSIPGTAIANSAVGATQVANNAISSAKTSNEPGVVFSFVNTTAAVTSTPASFANVPMRVPADGYVKVEVTGQWNNSTGGNDTVFCQLQKGAVAAVDLAAPWFALRDRSAVNDFTTFSAHRVLPVAAADNPLQVTQGQQFRLVCDLTAGAVSLYDIHISATYYATDYSPANFAIPLDPPPPSQ
jgi:hypothetical protein